VNKAKSRNNHPPQNATKRSEIFFEIKLPPMTAMNVANKCPAVAYGHADWILRRT
jgi:hypothetical protein